ncbi:MAG: MarR family transcriptional regulator [Thermobacillus sp.]|uniref:MarR family winged helix-turn-helix transcriptional regulator n=1 Tax=Thermobacillus sp. TaxID=2108467 RepID=UPI000E383F6D|nr:winged helix DNA-binding protein [Thermobacillus sp.]REK56586.1 MAG: MarR family transcriptional regulator [Thermobacillus sp.]
MDYRRLVEELFESMRRSRRPPFPEEPRGITHGELGILMYLTHRRDGVSAGELSRWLRITTGRVAAALKSLERKRFIERRRDEADRRRVLVHVTEEGRAFALGRHEEAKRGMERLLRRLGERDAREFVRILKRIHEMAPEED